MGAWRCSRLGFGVQSRGGVCPLRPGSSDVNLFRYCECVIDLDPEVSDRALDLRRWL
jgi:hypothetical protein